MTDLLSLLSSSVGTSPVDQLVSQYMALERKPLSTLEASRDQLDVRSAMFNDLKSRLADLRDLADDLALDTGSVFDTHTATSSNSAAVTASAGSSAADGSYLLENVTLAQAETTHFGWLDGAWTTGAGGSFTLNGTTITADPGVTLAGLRDAINGASYADGRGVQASIVNSTVGGVTQSTLVLAATSTGAAGAITIADDSGGVIASLGGQVITQEAADASFTINGVPVVSSKNGGISDVIEGISFDLKAAAEQVTIQVAADTSGMRSKVEAFLQKYNSLIDYVKDKSAITKDANDNYSRGLLYGYTLYTGLRSELPALLSGSVAGLDTQSPTRLSELGIEMDSNLHFTVKDGTKLDDWLETNPGGVKQLFAGDSGIAKSLANKLEPYAGDLAAGITSYIDREQTSLDAQRKSIDNNIDSQNERLAMREEQLRSQFTTLQAMITELNQQQQTLQSVFSATASWGV